MSSFYIVMLSVVMLNVMAPMNDLKLLNQPDHLQTISFNPAYCYHANKEHYFKNASRLCRSKHLQYWSLLKINEIELKINDTK